MIPIAAALGGKLQDALSAAEFGGEVIGDHAHFLHAIGVRNNSGLVPGRPLHADAIHLNVVAEGRAAVDRDGGEGTAAIDADPEGVNGLGVVQLGAPDNTGLQRRVVEGIAGDIGDNVDDGAVGHAADAGGLDLRVERVGCDLDARGDGPDDKRHRDANGLGRGHLNARHLGGIEAFLGNLESVSAELEVGDAELARLVRRGGEILVGLFGADLDLRGGYGGAGLVGHGADYGARADLRSNVEQRGEKQCCGD